MTRITLLIGFVLTFGCSNHSSNKVADIQENSDSLTENQSDNELIFDFYYKYGSQESFQIERTKFPLTIQVNNEVSLINSDNWKHDYLFLNLQYITHIFDTKMNSFDYSRDYGNKSIFSWIYPSREIRKDYYFIRENGKWYLSKILVSKIVSESSEDFIQFLDKFMSDSIFQKSRIQFPLTYNTWYDSKEQDFKDTTYTLKPSEFDFISLYNGLDSLTNFKNDWDIKPLKGDERLIFVGGVENGILIEYYFKLIDDKWFLIEESDQST